MTLYMLDLDLGGVGYKLVSRMIGVSVKSGGTAFSLSCLSCLSYEVVVKDNPRGRSVGFPTYRQFINSPSPFLWRFIIPTASPSGNY